ncbi:MAG: HPF/RaiA family ribosome-associated protein [Rhodomicrobium sp.]
MRVPLQVAFEGIQHSDAIEARIREEAEKLEQFFGRLISARVVVARPQHRHHKGDIYHIRIHLAVPDAADIAVSREPAATGAHEDVYVTIRDAFKAARRQLQDIVRKREGHVKEHDVPAHGVIAALHARAGYGFIASSDGREIYFHRNSVAEDRFDELEVGEEVRFSESEGGRGRRRALCSPWANITLAKDPQACKDGRMTDPIWPQLETRFLA